ncbi:methyltransferase family protein [Lachnoclostridium sp. Marseille-P6806]|uniref:methyltransferase family protein n=1 Tax=Lachnoclostridium sp. Marseille-P6806 TaxID=2364793 RepID=UPI001032564C|nr:isoprenylcysteine carboxylmethyltransferase family protein [Lachnoclostridium sp. Marseille-P6806]
MTGKLCFQAAAKFLIGLLIMMLLLFFPAGTLRYWNGWLLIGILFIPMLIAGAVMLLRRPDLLKKRLNTEEKEKEQKKAVALSAVMFVAAFVVAGLNFRYEWLHMLKWMICAAVVLFAAAYLLYAEVLRENVYLSRTVEVQENQKVIDTGLYGIVRHPMYSATLLLFPSMGLVLGSPVSFLIFLLYIPIIAGRIKNEEKILMEGLEGYAAYRNKVRYRIIPGIW